MELGNGWWLGTNLSKARVREHIKTACGIEGVGFGSQLKLIECYALLSIASQDDDATLVCHDCIDDPFLAEEEVREEGVTVLVTTVAGR